MNHQIFDAHDNVLTTFDEVPRQRAVINGISIHILYPDRVRAFNIPIGGQHKRKPVPYPCKAHWPKVIFTLEFILLYKFAVHKLVNACLSISVVSGRRNVYRAVCIYIHRIDTDLAILLRSYKIHLIILQIVGVKRCIRIAIHSKTNLIRRNKEEGIVPEKAHRVIDAQFSVEGFLKHAVETFSVKIAAEEFQPFFRQPALHKIGRRRKESLAAVDIEALESMLISVYRKELFPVAPVEFFPAQGIKHSAVGSFSRNQKIQHAIIYVDPGTRAITNERIAFSIVFVLLMDAIGLSAQCAEFAADLIGIEYIASVIIFPIIRILGFRKINTAGSAGSVTVSIRVICVGKINISGKGLGGCYFLRCIWFFRFCRLAMFRGHVGDISFAGNNRLVFGAGSKRKKENER